jgi:hypothetical protein
VYDGSKVITFDPFYSGRCNVPSDAPHLATWSDTAGPGIKVKLYYEQNQSNCGELTNKDDLETLVAAGYKRTVAAQFATYVNTICLPTPCKYDPKTGVEIGGKWDASIKACTCPIGGSVPVREDQDNNGNAIDAAAGYPNACYAVPIRYDPNDNEAINFIEFGNVQPDSTPQTYFVSYPSEPMEIFLTPLNPICIFFQRPAMWDEYVTRVIKKPNWWGMETNGTVSLIWIHSLPNNVETSQNPVIMAMDIVYGSQSHDFYDGFAWTDPVPFWREILNIMSSRHDPFRNHNATDQPAGTKTVTSITFNRTRIYRYFARRTPLVYMGGVTTTVGVYTSPAVIPSPYLWQNNVNGHKTNILIIKINMTSQEMHINNTWEAEEDQTISEDRVDSDHLFNIPAVPPFIPDYRNKNP